MPSRPGEPIHSLWNVGAEGSGWGDRHHRVTHRWTGALHSEVSGQTASTSEPILNGQLITVSNYHDFLRHFPRDSPKGKGKSYPRETKCQVSNPRENTLLSGRARTRWLSH